LRATSLWRRNYGLRLKEIGAYFGRGEPAVSQTSRRFGMMLEKDRKLNIVMKDIYNRSEIV
jgi:hypothetical protein